MASLLELRIDEPWLIGVVGALSVGLIVVLLIRRRVERWPLWAALSMTVGASAAIAFALYARKTNLFGMPLPWQAVSGVRAVRPPSGWPSRTSWGLRGGGEWSLSSPSRSS